MTSLLIQPLAELDLIEIEGFSRDNFGDDVAQSYMDAIERALDRLLLHPQSGTHFEGIRPPIRYLGIGKHRIFYDFDGKAISVVRVLHQAMVPEDHL